MTRDGFKAATCADCGHHVGEHLSSGAGWPHPPRYGVCVVAGCECREYRADTETRAAA